MKTEIPMRTSRLWSILPFVRSTASLSGSSTVSAKVVGTLKRKVIREKLYLWLSVEIRQHNYNCNDSVNGNENDNNVTNGRDRHDNTVSDDKGIVGKFIRSIHC